MASRTERDGAAELLDSTSCREDHGDVGAPAQRRLRLPVPAAEHRIGGRTAAYWQSLTAYYTGCGYPAGRPRSHHRAGDEMEEMVEEAARYADDPGSLVRALAQNVASRLERSGYQSGCAIATMVLELASPRRGIQRRLRQRVRAMAGPRWLPASNR